MSLIFSAERELLSITNFASIVIWDMERGEPKRSISSGGNVNLSCACVFDKTLISGDKQFVCFWEIATLTILKKVQAHRDLIIGIK